MGSFLKACLVYVLTCVGTVSAGEVCFNERYYLDMYPEVMEQINSHEFENASDHYKKIGATEGRLACPTNSLERLCTPGKSRRPCELSSGPQTFDVGQGNPRFYGLFSALCLFTLLILTGFKRKFHLRLLALATVLSGFATFNYVSAKHIFVFRDIAVDTIDQFWPTIVYLSKTIYAGELPLWTHAAGMGQSIFPSWLSDPFALLAILSGPDNVTYMIGFVHALKPILAALFFWLYLKERNYSDFSATVSSLCLAFCGHLIGRGTWYQYATEVVVIAFYLYANERFLKRKQFALLSIATALFAMAGTHQAYINGLLATFYTLVRFFVFGADIPDRRSIRLIWFFTASFVGGLLVSIFLLPDVWLTLTSSRVQGQWSVYQHTLQIPLFVMSPFKTIHTSLARLVSPSLLGPPRDYTGVGNFLEDSLPYAGLIAIPCVLSGLFILSPKGRITTGAFLALALGYHVFTHVRMIFNAYAGLYFKISNFWLAVGLAMSIAAVLETLYRSANKKNWIIFLGGWIAAIVLVVWIRNAAPALGSKPDDPTSICALIIALLVGAVSITSLFRRGILKPFSQKVVIFAVCLDLGFNAYYILNASRGGLDGTFWGLHSGYYDTSYQLIKKIQSKDSDQYYRFEKDFNSVHLNDSLMQGYLGTKAYFSLTNPSYARFSEVFGLLGNGPRPESYLAGIGGRPFMMMPLGIKYFLTHKIDQVPGFERVQTQGSLHAFQNTFNVPSGFVYEKVITEATLRTLASAEARTAAIYDFLVIDDEAPVEWQRSSTEDMQRLVSEIYAEDHVPKESSINWSKALDEMRQNSVRPFHVETWSSNQITGYYESDVNGYLFLPISYDSGWEILQDGQKVPYFHGNIGFMALKAHKGRHQIEMQYKPPVLFFGFLVSSLGFLILLVYGFVNRRQSATQRRAGFGQGSRGSGQSMA